jgi:2,3-bisphosphoglycerate-dependent phosphoglycerate mutase
MHKVTGTGKKRFTGQANRSRTEHGRNEAILVAECLQHNNYRFDIAWSSRLARTPKTLDIILNSINQDSIPRSLDWPLNERHYGQLQSVDKSIAAVNVGKKQVWQWRRGY